MKGLHSRAPWALLLLLWASVGLSAEIRFDQRYIEAINKSSGITPIGVDSFGENVDLSTGSVSFRWTDIDIPGNSGLPVRLQRQLVIEDKELGGGGDLGGFGSAGSIDIPYLKGIHSTNGWQVSGTSPNSRCSLASKSPPAFAGGTLTASDYWSGNWLHIPWEGDQAMLANPAAVLPKPSSETPIMTRNFWAFACTPTTKNGYPGEGFIAISPRGERYYFDWVITKGYPALSKRYGNYAHSTARMSRQVVYFLVSRIEDRFGNWVKYDYVGDKLSQITSSDGRYITISAWNGSDIAVVNSSVGQWSYAYAANSLVTTQPDGSHWTYAATGALRVDPSPSLPLYDPAPRCPAPEPSSGGYNLAVTQPSGAKATFQFAVRRHWTSNVPEMCNSFIDESLMSYKFLEIPNFSDALTLISKTVEGPGLEVMQWQYSYSGGGGPFSFEELCNNPPSGLAECQEKRWTTVRGPNRSYRQYAFGSMFNVNTGQLLSVDEGYETGVSPDIEAVILRQTVNTYLSASEVSGQPFPDSVGTQGSWRFDATQALLRPLKASSIAQDGASFTRINSAFDVMARPIAATKGSSFGQLLTESTEYHDDPSLWVIGQVKRTTSNGIEASKVDYGWKALPWKTYSFGKLEAIYSYDTTDGTLKTVSDGRDGAGFETTITLSSWKRGIPQSIKYPATPESPTGATESAVVNDDGTIASVNDENASKTCYGYDAMGRLASITYPSEVATSVCDSSTWATTTLSFTPVTTDDEYGIPAGHWKQTVSTGNARKITYFDALWRPLVEESYDNASPSTTRSVTVKHYDEEGRLIFQSYPIASLMDHSDSTLKGTHTTYDALDRVKRIGQDSELGVLVTTTSYLSDSNGLYTLVTNPRTEQTRTWFQMFDQPDYSKPIMIWHPEGAYTHISRDVFGKPTRLRRSNSSSPTGGTVAQNRDYVYDIYQQLCRTVEPETNTSVYDYDLAGNIQWTASGQVFGSPTTCERASVPEADKVYRTYDSRNRLKTLTFPDQNGDQVWNYWPDGPVKDITTLNDAGTSTVINAYTYNNRRLLTGEAMSQTGNTTAWSLGYSYDSLGHQAALTQPGGEVLSFAPNALGQATKVTSPYANYATGAIYYPNDALKQFTYGNSIVHKMTQNARGLPERSWDASTTTTVLDDSYDYDANANVAAISDGLPGSRGNRDMTYDGLDRLTKVVSPMYATTVDSEARYGYDILDNLITLHIKDRHNFYCYDGNWQLIVIKTSYCSTGAAVVGLEYDDRGNLENKNGQEFHFDFGNRLRTVVGKETYRYDGQGRRVLATSEQELGAIRSVYGMDGVLRYQRDDRQDKVFNHIYLAGSLVATRETPYGTSTNTIKYQHTDALGSPVAVTDASRNVLERNEYEPYGKVLVPASPQDGPGYTGHVLDAATGMNYMQQRYYDPGIGRFLSVDPVTADSNTGDNFNRYWYANNNPYKFTDPDGRASYLVSRPLDSKLSGIAGNHNFIVHHAGGPGDPNATVRSFGITSEGTMGEVTPNTEGPNANTSAMDTAAWESLGSEGSGVTFREINASDEVVQANADSVSSSFDYSYVPEVSGGFNSNTAAGAVAQESDGGSPRVDNGRPQHGTSQERVSTAREQVLIEPIKDK